MASACPNRDRIVTCLKWTAGFSAGLLLACAVEIGTAEWIIEATTGPGLTDDEGSERWLSLVQRDTKRQTLAFQLMPLGAGTLAGSILSLLFLSKGRFRLRSLLIGMLFTSLLVGIPLGFVRPRLQNPRVWYRVASGDIAFTQIRRHADPTFSANSTHSLLNRRMAVEAFIPLLTVPLITVWFVRRNRRHPSQAEGFARGD